MKDKNKGFVGQPVLSQIFNLMPSSLIFIANRKYKANRYYKRITYAFSNPGTYFPTLWVTSQRQGDGKMPYARIRNLGRVRVVVNQAKN